MWLCTLCSKEGGCYNSTLFQLDLVRNIPVWLLEFQGCWHWWNMTYAWRTIDQGHDHLGLPTGRAEGQCWLPGGHTLGLGGQGTSVFLLKPKAQGLVIICSACLNPRGAPWLWEVEQNSKEEKIKGNESKPIIWGSKPQIVWQKGDALNYMRAWHFDNTLFQIFLKLKGNLSLYYLEWFWKAMEFCPRFSTQAWEGGGLTIGKTLGFSFHCNRTNYLHKVVY